MNLSNTVKTPRNDHARRHFRFVRKLSDSPCAATFLPRKYLLLLALIIPLWTAPLMAQAASRKDKPPTRADVLEKKGDLKEIRGQIESLRKNMAVAEDKRADAADEVKEVDQAIAGTQRELVRLTRQRDALQATLGDLGKQSHALEKELNSQQEPLQRLVARRYLQGAPDSLRLMLNGDNPSQVARDLYYLSTISQARSELLRAIESTLERKHALAEDTRARAEELKAVDDRQRAQHGKLLAQRQQRKAVLDRLAATVSEQRRKIGNLQRDEKQLSQLIQRLARAIAARPAPRPERKSARSDPGTAPPARGITNDATPEPVPAGNFAQLKGRLRLPTRGVVTTRFGGTRQEGSTWKGLFIRAAADSEVKAIAGGRVVFADWMRGFGNLLIIDHGGNYLSIYGNNDSLQKQVGDNVAGGDAIAAVGNSGGNPESGLYFELRQQGQAIDPLKWVNLK